MPSTIWYLSTAVVAVLVAFMVVRVWRWLRYFESRGFERLPFVDVLELNIKVLTGRINMHEFTRSVYQRFPADLTIGGYYQFGRPTFMVLDPELGHQMLTKDFSYFHDHGFDVDLDTNPLDGNLFSMDGARWRALRNRLAPTFTAAKLRVMYDRTAAKARHLVRILEEDTSPERDVLVRSYLSRFTIDSIASNVFSVEAGALDDPGGSEFRRMAEMISKPGPVHFMRMVLKIVAPWAARIVRVRSVPDEVVHFFTDVVRQAMEMRRSAGEKRNDLVDVLLQLRDKGSLEFDPRSTAMKLSESKDEQDNSEYKPVKIVLSDELLTAQAFSFLVAGWESIAHASALVLYHLGKDKLAQDRARAEIREAKQRHGGEMTFDALKEMVYLECCASESMRLFPPSSVIFRVCTKSYPLEDGRVIEKGSPIIIPNTAFQLDPRYFPEPKHFKPERFMPNEPITPGSYLTFGEGPRVCIGQCRLLTTLRWSVEL